MRDLLPALLGIAVVATVLVLFAGVISFAFGNRTDRKLATRLMTARVVLQGLALAIFALIVLLSVN